MEIMWIQNSWIIGNRGDSKVLNLANDRDYILTELDGIDGGKCSFCALNLENDYESENEESEWVVQPN